MKKSFDSLSLGVADLRAFKFYGNLCLFAMSSRTVAGSATPISEIYITNNLTAPARLLRCGETAMKESIQLISFC